MRCVADKLAETVLQAGDRELGLRDDLHRRLIFCLGLVEIEPRRIAAIDPRAGDAQ